MLERKYDEKRFFCRMQVDAEVSYTLPGETNAFKGQCMNLSHSGIQFVAGQALSKGQAIEVVIDTKSEKFQPMKALIEIIRVERSEDNRYMAAGVIKEYK